jgi:hypothetical protein
MLFKTAAHSAESTQFRLIHAMMMIGQDAIHFDGSDQGCQWIFLLIIVEGNTGDDGSTEQPEVVAILNKSSSRQALCVKGLEKICKIGQQFASEFQIFSDPHP